MISTRIMKVALGLALSFWMAGGDAVPAQPANDDHGDALPHAAYARLGTIRFRHPFGQFVAFSPDGKIIATRGDGNIRLWDVAEGRELRRLAPVSGPPDPDYSHYVPMVFSPDGKFLASGGVLNFNTRDHKDAIEIWEVATGKKVREFFTGRVDSVYCLAYSPDGKTLVVADSEETIRLLDADTGAEQKKLDFRAPGWMCMGLRYSADGKLVAHGRIYKDNRQSHVEIREVVSGKLILQMKRNYDCCALSDDGKMLIVADRRNFISVWEVATAKMVREWQSAQGQIGALALTGDGKTVATLGEGTLQLWDVATGKRAEAHDTVAGPASALALAATGNRLATRYANDRVQIWDIKTRKEIARYQHAEPIHSLTLSADGQLLAAGSKSGVTLWNTATAKEHRKLPGASWSGSANYVYHGTLAFSPDGKALAAACQQLFELPVFDVEGGKKIVQIKDIHLSCVAYSPDGKLIAGGGRTRKDFQNYFVALWDSSGRELHRFPLGGQRVTALSFSSNGKTLAAGLEGWQDVPTLRAWDTASGGELSAFEQTRRATVTTANQLGQFMYLRPHTIRCLALSPDGRTIAAVEAGYDQHRANIYLWEVASGKERGLLRGHQDLVTAVAFLPDGKLISASSDWSVLFWDPRLLAGKTAPDNLPKEKLESLHADLAGDDPVRAYQAMHLLSQSPAIVPLLKDRLRRAPGFDPDKVAEHIKNLDAAEFAARAHAAAELEKVGGATVPALKKALEGNPSLEVKRRLEELLAKATRRTLAKEDLAAWRAIEVLEGLGSLEAKQVLESLAQGGAGHRLTVEAQATLQRLGKQ